VFKKSKVLKIIRNVFIIVFFIIILVILNAGGLLTYTLVNKRADFKKLDQAKDYGIVSENIKLQTIDNYEIDSYLVDCINPKGYIIILSGIYSPSVTTFYGYAKMFRELGYASLLVEMRAHGLSDGDKIMLGYTEQKDVNAAVDYVNKIDNEIPIIVFGTSMGGSVALNSTANNSRINAVISQSAYSSWEENIMDQFRVNGVPEFICKIQLPFTRLLLGFKYGFSNINNSPINNISKIPPEKIFLLHSTEDSQVIYTNFQRLTEKIDSPITTYTISGDKHFILQTDEEFFDPSINNEYYNCLISFLDKI